MPKQSNDWRDVSLGLTATIEHRLGSVEVAISRLVRLVARRDFLESGHMLGEYDICPICGLSLEDYIASPDICNPPRED